MTLLERIDLADGAFDERRITSGEKLALTLFAVFIEWSVEDPAPAAVLEWLERRWDRLLDELGSGELLAGERRRSP